MQSPPYITAKELFSAILLVAGTTIGGGMLGLPILTGQGGFLPSLLLYFVCWLFMASTGLLFLELCLAFGPGVNIVTLADKTLGLFGKIAAWILYIFLFYCLTVAYITGLGNLLASFMEGQITDQWAIFIITALAFPLLSIGPRFAAHLNRYFMGALFIAFFAFLFLGMGQINLDYLKHQDPRKSLIALPIAFVAFAYQGIVPTLTTLLHGDRKALRISIVAGSFIPFITYIFWQALVLGIVPLTGEHGLEMALLRGESAVIPLHHFLQNNALSLLGQFFGFFALLTSLIGVGLGLIDFLSDGLKVEKKAINRLFLSGLIFGPALLIAYTYPHLFLAALELAGGVGSALLLGLLPCLMVIQKRYFQNNHHFEELFGSKTILFLLIGFILFELVLCIKSFE